MRWCQAVIYLAEGDAALAAVSVAAMVPVAGDAVTAGKWAVKGAKELAEEAAEKAAKEAAEKLEKEAAEKAAKDAEKKATNGGHIKGGPCDHLKQGNGKGPYRGGAHSKTSKPLGDGKDSHHMPADDVSPLSRDAGPAIQMDPKDHRATSSNGSSREAINYRQSIESLLKKREWRKVMAIEIQDIREIAKSIGDPRKYNEAILEMLEYFKCLKKNNLLP